MNPSVYQAPRLTFYLGKVARRPLFVMPRADWDRLKIHGPAVVPIDLQTTPIANPRLETCLEAAVAERQPTGQAIISIYRRDPKDEPTPINKDEYQVWEFLPGRFHLPSLVIQASTEDNANLRGFLSEHVFLVKNRPGDDHWMDKLPPRVWAAINATRNNPV